jgi:hypothetical protein
VLGYKPVECSSTCIPAALANQGLICSATSYHLVYKVVFEVLIAVPMKMTRLYGVVPEDSHLVSTM